MHFLFCGEKKHVLKWDTLRCKLIQSPKRPSNKGAVNNNHKRRLNWPNLHLIGKWFFSSTSFVRNFQQKTFNNNVLSNKVGNAYINEQLSYYYFDSSKSNYNLRFCAANQYIRITKRYFFSNPVLCWPLWTLFLQYTIGGKEMEPSSIN